MFSGLSDHSRCFSWVRKRFTAPHVRHVTTTCFWRCAKRREQKYHFENRWGYLLLPFHCMFSNQWQAGVVYRTCTLYACATIVDTGQICTSEPLSAGHPRHQQGVTRLAQWPLDTGVPAIIGNLELECFLCRNKPLQMNTTFSTHYIYPCTQAFNPASVGLVLYKAWV